MRLNEALNRRRFCRQILNASVLFTVFILDVNEDDFKVPYDFNVSSIKTVNEIKGNCRRKVTIRLGVFPKKCPADWFRTFDLVLHVSVCFRIQNKDKLGLLKLRNTIFGVFRVAKIHLRVKSEFLGTIFFLRSSLSLHYHGSSLYTTQTYKWV